MSKAKVDGNDGLRDVLRTMVAAIAWREETAKIEILAAIDEATGYADPTGADEPSA